MAGLSAVSSPLFLCQEFLVPTPPAPHPRMAFPLSFLVMEALALLCFIVAGASLAGFGALLHPLLADSGAGIAMLVTAVSLLISGFFPLVLRRLMNKEEAARRAQ